MPTYRYLNSSGGQYQTDFLGKAVKIQAKSEGNFLSRTFAGAKRLALFDDYEERFNVKHFDLAIDFGWFYFLTKPFFYASIIILFLKVNTPKSLLFNSFNSIFHASLCSFMIAFKTNL